MANLTTAEQRLARQFGEMLRQRRKTMGYTQEDLASMIGANRRFVGELERGKGTSHLATALAAAEAVGLQLSDLFGRTDHRAQAATLPPARSR